MIALREPNCARSGPGENRGRQSRPFPLEKAVHSHPQLLSMIERVKAACGPPTLAIQRQNFVILRGGGRTQLAGFL